MITVNRIKCNKCGDVIQSIHRHDFKMCKCGSCGADGGLSYLRRIGTDYIEMSLQHTDDIELIRQHMFWGKNYNANKELLPKTEWVLLKDITDSHLDALILYWEERLSRYENADKLLDIFKREKELRYEFNVQFKKSVLSEE